MSLSAHFTSIGSGLPERTAESSSMESGTIMPDEKLSVARVTVLLYQYASKTQASPLRMNTFDLKEGSVVLAQPVMSGTQPVVFSRRRSNFARRMECRPPASCVSFVRKVLNSWSSTVVSMEPTSTNDARERYCKGELGGN